VKLIRTFLFAMLAVLLIVDLRVAELMLHGPDVLQVVGDGEGWRVVPMRVGVVDYFAFASLLVLHGIVAFGFIRTRNSGRRATNISS
jgi:hypothetical protein